MAESVERHMESMAEEIEEMRRIKLYSVDETRVILKKRKHFEYKINGVTKNLKDFKDYIQYEEVVLKDIKIRRNKYRIAERKSAIEHNILKRIKYLYEIAYQRFSDDFSFCLSYFKFCKKSNYKGPASLIIQNMIKNFPHKPEMWQIAAAWYIGTDLSKALNVIHKGLTIHRDSQILYKEAIQLELVNRDRDKQNKDTKLAESKDISCDRLRTYILSIFKNISDFKFLLEILKLLEPHKFTVSIQNMIIDKLTECYCNEELVWHTLAQRERCTDEKLSADSMMRCRQKYQEGFAKISEAKRPALWTLYLDFLIELQQENEVPFNDNLLVTALENASQQIALDEKYFIVWAKLTNDEKETIDVINKGLKATPSSVELWKLKLRCAILKDHVETVNQAFKEGLLELKEKSAPLWLMILRYHSLTSNHDILNSIYEDGVKQPKEVSDILKPEYIRWLALTKGIREARKKYNMLAREIPHCKELHTAMFKLESIEMDQEIEEIENVLNLACEQFGSEDVDIWINRIEFYLQNHKKFEDVNSRFNINDKILSIYRRAESMLKQSNDGLLLPDFKEKYMKCISEDSGLLTNWMENRTK